MSEALAETIVEAGADNGGADGGKAAGEAGKAAPEAGKGAEAGKDGAEAAKGGEGKAADASLANGADLDTKGAEKPQNWPDNWRELLAGDDKKTLERLGRFASPADIWKAQQEAARKISEGLKPRQKPDAKASEDDWKEYRKAAGIPDTVDDFVKAIELSDKRQIGEEDKPVVNAFAERAIKAGVHPSDMSALVDEYYAMQEEQANQLVERDAEFRRESMQQLRDEYGGDFKANINAMRPYFESVDKELFDGLMGGRLADGTRIGDNPGIIRFFVAKALAENPAATILPAGSANIETIDQEIAALKKRMSEDRNAWFKDEAAQKRYQQLIAARSKLAK